jgi:shikimate kinase
MDKILRIVLIGFRGTGKSTIGKMLAKQLKWKYVSTDEMIENQSQKSIIDIVTDSGWKEFRVRENKVLGKVSNEEYTVIDCGGGAIEDASNMVHFISKSLIIWIDADLEDILNRISGSEHARPLLDQSDENTDYERHYIRRRPLYQKYADLHFSSSEHSPEEICQLIKNEINSE